VPPVAVALARRAATESRWPGSAFFRYRIADLRLEPAAR
jgi:hypothetical protein